MAIKAKIQFLTGDLKGKVVNVEKLPIIIGRVESCDIVLAGDPGVSRKHAELRSDGERVIVTDLGSSGGTTVNQRKITGEQPLKAGDVIGVGKYQMRIALPTPKSGAAKAKLKAEEEQEATAFVDMAKIMAGGDDQEGTAFVDMNKLIDEAGAARGQDGTVALDMEKVFASKTLGERWRDLPTRKKLLIGSGGGLVALLVLVAVVSSLMPAPKEPKLEDEVIKVTVNGTTKVTIPRARDIATKPTDIVIAWLDEGVDSIAQLKGLEEGEAQLTVTTREGDIHVWNVVVEGYEDPYKAFTAQQRLERGKKALADGDEKWRLAEKDPEKVWYAYNAYWDAYMYLSGAQFAPPELVKEAEEKMTKAETILETAQEKFEADYSQAVELEQWDRALRALETLARIYPDLDDPQHKQYMYLIRIVKEKQAGR